MNEQMELKVPLINDLFTTVRLATGGYCSYIGMNMDDSEDCKVCITESLLLLFRSGFTRARLIFGQDDGLCVRAVGENRQAEAKESEEDDISCALLEALVDELHMGREGGVLNEISFRFGKENGR